MRATHKRRKQIIVDSSPQWIFTNTQTKQFISLILSTWKEWPCVILQRIKAKKKLQPTFTNPVTDTQRQNSVHTEICLEMLWRGTRHLGFFGCWGIRGIRIRFNQVIWWWVADLERNKTKAGCFLTSYLGPSNYFSSRLFLCLSLNLTNAFPFLSA